MVAHLILNCPTTRHSHCLAVHTCASVPWLLAACHKGMSEQHLYEANGVISPGMHAARKSENLSFARYYAAPQCKIHARKAPWSNQACALQPSGKKPARSLLTVLLGIGEEAESHQALLGLSGCGGTLLIMRRSASQTVPNTKLRLKLQSPASWHGGAPDPDAPVHEGAGGEHGCPAPEGEAEVGLHPCTQQTPHGL